ncbi:ATP-dependent zinc metalloprotease FTSH 4, mitochondrial isoform X2 [Medicago truncatula]|uniref:ATP-dependent zinc metalloprotease FTSH 4, mitochondrial isoform X2 n=1 Tax=Medicago truncatula TaxID=3880 RepID=UPI0019685A4A|nr:ATP-dependent zinc metalloprotease FTSH 4, mitochondrial isoform X2 [Medicago truncatula]
MVALEVERRQSEFGKVKELLSRNYVSHNKFEGCPKNRLFISQSRYLGNLVRPLCGSSEAEKSTSPKELYDENDPEAVIRAFESNPSLHTNYLAFSEYVKALVKVGRLSESEFLKTLLRAISNSAKKEESSIGGIAALTNVGEPTRDGILETTSAPTDMVAALEGGNFKEQYGIQFGLLQWPSTEFNSIINLNLICTFSVLLFTLFFYITFMYKEVQPSLETSTKLSDMKGVGEAKAELEEIVDYLKDPKHFTRLGGKLPKGILIVGPPGTGKTMLARAIAGEAEVPFFSTSGREFEEMVVGVGAQRVRDLFAAAKKRLPCIIFIDEIDAFGGKLNSNDQMYMKLTLNQMLVELDGLKQNEGIIVIGATKSHKLIDEALLRHGRFDRLVVVRKPDEEGRREILEYHMSKVLKADNVDLMKIAQFTPGFSGAGLANLVNIAALRAAKDGAEAVSTLDLEFALDMIIMGSQRKSVVISEESREKTAFHECGHALVAIYTDGANPIDKATIVPHGGYRGRVYYLPRDKDENRLSRKRMLAKLDVSMGGRVAEVLIFGQSGVNAGACSDIFKATSLARRMVTRYGMSTEVGPVSHDYFDNGRSMSSETRLLIEKEVKNLLERACNNAKTILTTHQKELHVLTKALLKHQTLTGKQIKDLLANGQSRVVKAKAKFGLMICDGMEWNEIE